MSHKPFLSKRTHWRIRATKCPELSCETRAQSSWTRSCFTPPPNCSLTVHQSTYRAQVVNTLALLFLWHSPSLSFWPSSVHFPSRHLRSSSDSRILRVPHTKTITFSKSFIFPYSCPSVWKSLASEIGDTQSTTAFKTALRTHPFKSVTVWGSLQCFGNGRRVYNSLRGQKVSELLRCFCDGRRVHNYLRVTEGLRTLALLWQWP